MFKFFLFSLFGIFTFNCSSKATNDYLTFLLTNGQNQNSTAAGNSDPFGTLGNTVVYQEDENTTSSDTSKQWKRFDNSVVNNFTGTIRLAIAPKMGSINSNDLIEIGQFKGNGNQGVVIAFSDMELKEGYNEDSVIALSMVMENINDEKEAKSFVSEIKKPDVSTSFLSDSLTSFSLKNVKNSNSILKKQTLSQSLTSLRTAATNANVSASAIPQKSLVVQKKKALNQNSNPGVNANSKIKEVVMGDDFTVIHTVKNNLFVFGESSKGNLGLGSTTPTSQDCEAATGITNGYRCFIPTWLNDSNINGKVKKVTVKGLSVFVQTTDNKLFVFGDNSKGQLGLGNTNQQNSPVELTNANISGKVKKVSVGGFLPSAVGATHIVSTFIETTDNKLFVFGDNSKGQLGLGNTNQQDSPVELSNAGLNGKVKKINTSGLSTFIETTDNKLFVFGNNGYGQLGLGKPGTGTSLAAKCSTDGYECHNPVELTDANIKGKVRNVTLYGNNAFIETTDDKLFVFGTSVNGGKEPVFSLGLGNNPANTYASSCEKESSSNFIVRCYKPVELTNFSGQVKKVHISSTQALIQTTDGSVYAFGDNTYGQLGLGSSAMGNPTTPTNSNCQNKSGYGSSPGFTSSFCHTPTEIAKFQNKIRKISLGEKHSFIETMKGKIFFSGLNDKGQLGLGSNPSSSECSGSGSNKKCHTYAEVKSSDIQGKVTKVIVHSNRTFIETLSGNFYVFGDNSKGQLGLGKTLPSTNKCNASSNYCHTPILVQSLNN